MNTPCSRCSAALDKSGPLCELCLKADGLVTDIKIMITQAIGQAVHAERKACERRIADIVLAERERCAAIARKALRGATVSFCGDHYIKTCKNIVAKIVEGK